MTRMISAACTLAVFALMGVAAEKKIQMKDLPPAVQKTVEEQTKGAQVKNIIAETEKGQKMYEVETIVGGKARDFIVDAKGTLVEVEQEVALDTIPAAAKTAIEKKVAGGKLGMVETVTKGSTLSYEAAYTSKAGKKGSVSVNADGSPVK